MPRESTHATLDLFETAEAARRQEALGRGAVLLRGFAASAAAALLAAVQDVAVKAPFRHMVTPGGFRRKTDGPDQ